MYFSTFKTKNYNLKNIFKEIKKVPLQQRFCLGPTLPCPQVGERKQEWPGGLGARPPRQSPGRGAGLALGPRSSRLAVFVCRCAVHPSEKLLIVNSSIKKPPLLSALPADGAKAPVAFASRVCDAQAPGAATEQESRPAPSPPTRDGLLRTPGRVSRSRLAGRRPWQPSTHTGARSSKLIADPENSKPEVARARAAPPSGVPAALGQPGGGDASRRPGAAPAQTNLSQWPGVQTARAAFVSDK